MKANIMALCLVIVAGLFVLPMGCSTGNKNSTSKGSLTNIENEHEYVDLGLSVKWATCNVGANVPEEYGNNYAWGEVRPKTEYDLSNYKYYDRNSLSLNLLYSCYGSVDGRTTLEAMDDAATVNWSGRWRMPTKAEWDELKDSCIWTWTIRNGVNGYEVKSKVNDNSIFLPYSRVRIATNFGYAENGWYWSASLSDANPGGAWCVRIGDINGVNYRLDARCSGLPVRPVHP